MKPNSREYREKHGGWIKWGESSDEHAHLTAAQWRALYAIVVDRQNTRTREAFVTKRTHVWDHKVDVSAGAVRVLEQLKLVVTWYFGSDSYRWKLVGAADRAIIAFKMEELAAAV